MASPKSAKAEVKQSPASKSKAASQVVDLSATKGIKAELMEWISSQEEELLEPLLVSSRLSLRSLMCFACGNVSGDVSGDVIYHHFS
jgi:hypothetical protein